MNVAVADRLLWTDAMDLGNQIILELGRRGQLGQFFDYADYKSLRAVADSVDLKRFLIANDYQSPPQLETAGAAIDYMQAVERNLQSQEAFWFWGFMFAGSSFLDLVLLIPYAALRLTRKRRKGL